ncbi:hypothetical protein RB25_23620 [Herbaspirillum rubrisubalbicans]|uniref:Uncharacterized protein n=1 Tax=Herbaspirillum rubrisubalbicans TaxID=80842 RepID=A0ABX9BWD2_9BURK|nr:hypothetical protein RB24_22885 [Herbaspirillum rubrisubalbicans]RAN43244.1 hypothetical protein RB25_23620 [Herbaspirillum rubrisubalbicans]
MAVSIASGSQIKQCEQERGRCAVQKMARGQKMHTAFVQEGIKAGKLLVIILIGLESGLGAA